MKQCFFITELITCHVGGEYERNNESSDSNKMQGPCIHFESGDGASQSYISFGGGSDLDIFYSFLLKI